MYYHLICNREIRMRLEPVRTEVVTRRSLTEETHVQTWKWDLVKKYFSRKIISIILLYIKQLLWLLFNVFVGWDFLSMWDFFSNPWKLEQDYLWFLTSGSKFCFSFGCERDLEKLFPNFKNGNFPEEFVARFRISNRLDRHSLIP